MNIYTGNFLSEDFNTYTKDVWCVDHFNLVVMNSPYQKMDSGNGASAQPLYNEFIEKALKISDKVLSIHPSRWMAGGKGLNSFRKNMLNRNDIKEIVHLENSKEVFENNVDIKGGVQYFLIDKNYKGLCKFNGVECNLNEFDIFVAPKFHSIIHKVKNFKNLSEIFVDRGNNLFDIETNDDKFCNEKVNNDFIKCYVSKLKGLEKFVQRGLIRQHKVIDSFKVITSRASGIGGDGFGNFILGYPNEVYSGSYFCLITPSYKETENLISYLQTKFVNFLLSLRKNTQDISKSSLIWIPLIDLSKSWTDEELYKEFNLMQEEIEIIENYINRCNRRTKRKH